MLVWNTSILGLGKSRSLFLEFEYREGGCVYRLDVYSTRTHPYYISIAGGSSLFPAPLMLGQYFDLCSSRLTCQLFYSQNLVSSWEHHCNRLTKVMRRQYKVWCGRWRRIFGCQCQQSLCLERRKTRFEIVFHTLSVCESQRSLWSMIIPQVAVFCHLLTVHSA